jgi:serine/threonine-protein kinase
MPLDHNLTIFPVTVDGAESEDLAPGTRAGSYTIDSKIGRGGYSTVYSATRDEGSRAAIKVLHRALLGAPHGVDRFLREAHALNKIKHPAIVEILEIGRVPDGRPYYAMELLHGVNLRRLLQREGRLSPIESYEIVEQVCAALGAAHAVGIVHRDVKPENVIVTSDRNVRLVDFGVAKLLEPDPGAPGLTTTQQVIGTPVAMAPEQILCLAVDQRTDIYGLGTLVYNMLTGVYPFRGKADDIARMHVETPPRPPSSVTALSLEIDAVVLRCLEKDPRARYPTVAAFLAAFRGAIFGDSTPTRARTGIALLVRATAADENDDDALTEAPMALYEAEEQLRAAGYQIKLQTSTEILGVIVTPTSSDQELAARRAARDLGHSLHAKLSGIAHGALRVAVTVHADEVHVREDTLAVAGGPLLEVGAWRATDDGLVVTGPAGAGLSPI